MDSDKTNKKHNLFEDDDNDNDSDGYHLDEYHRIFPHYPKPYPTPIKRFEGFKSMEDNILDIRTIVYTTQPPQKRFAIIETEPILTEPRNSIQPKKYPTIWKLTKALKGKKWDAEDVDFKKDQNDYLELTDLKKQALKRVMTDIINREGLDNKNIIDNFAREVTPHEFKHFYALKCTNNNNRDELYSLFIKNVYAQDPTEHIAIRFMYHMDGKIDDRKLWMNKWTTANQRAFAERLIASIAMEEIFCITNLAVLKQLMQNGSFPGLAEGMARFDDEQLTHYRVNLETNSLLIRSASPLIAREIIRDAVEYEIEYALSMNYYGRIYDANKTSKDIMKRADEILSDLNLPKIYNFHEEAPKYCGDH